MEKKQKVAPEGEPPLKQFSVCKTNPFGQTNSVFGAAHTPPPFGPSCSPAFGSSMPAFGSSSTPAFGSSSTSFGGSSGFGQKNLKEVEATRTNIQKLLKEIGSSGFGQKPQKLDYREFTYPTNIEKLFKEVAHLGSSDPTMRYQQLEAVGFFDASFQIWKQSFQATPFQRATQLGLGSAPAFGAISLTYSISSRQIITEEDKRFESWFAIAGADYCVIAADFTGDHTNISQLSGKCVMASCGVQANVKNLQKILCAENLKYECQHKKQLSCVKMERLFRHHHLLSDPIPRSLCGFILLGGLDSKGKGCFFRPLCPGCVYFPDSGLGPTVPPIFKFKLPAEDVVARMSETEAVALAKEVFKFATNTGDKLEIVVLNASGIRSECVDLKTGDKLGIVVPNASGQVLSRKRKRSSSV